MVGDLLVAVSGHRETTVPKVDSELFRRDSELGQKFMTCGKLPIQTPSVKSRLMAHTTALPSNCWGNRVG